MRFTRRPSRPWLLSAVLAALASNAWSGVLVVDSAGGPGSSHYSISLAVSAAAEGDTILVRDGTYFPFSITGKSLTLVADGDDAFVKGINQYGSRMWSVLVRDLGPGQQVLVRGLRMDYGVTVQDCDGSVWIDDVECTGGEASCASGVSPGAHVIHSGKVTITRSSFVGEVGDWFSWAPVASPGFRATGSSVQVFDSFFTGGDGESAGTSPTPHPGAAGMEVDGSTVTIFGCTITGGLGGIDPADPCVGAAPGGPGLLFSGDPGTVRSVESTATGGVTNLDPLCPGQTGPAGPAIAGSGTIVPMFGYARHLQANGPLRGGETLTFDVQGLPNETPLLLVSPTHEPLPLLGYSGVLLVGLPPEDMFLLAPLPASGQGSLSFPVPNVGPGVGAVSYYVQPIFLDPAPGIWLGAGTTVVLLDAGF